LASYTQSFAPAPTPGSNAVNTTVFANDSRIITSGPDWSTGMSSCDPSLSAKKNSAANEKLTFNFTGRAVFMSTTQSMTSGQYSVKIDDTPPVLIDGFADAQTKSCDVAWSAFGLQDKGHTIIVTTLGQSQKASMNNQQATAFELNRFTITQSPNSGGAAPFLTFWNAIGCLVILIVQLILL
jgi:hypothetical protein